MKPAVIFFGSLCVAKVRITCLVGMIRPSLFRVIRRAAVTLKACSSETNSSLL
ncbi:unnamed protein product, partial [Larinioides sclopetarius]